MGKDKRIQRTISFIFDVICVMTVTVASFFIYSTLSEALDGWLQAHNIVDPWLKTAFILFAAIAILLVLGGERLGKAIQKIFGR